MQTNLDNESMKIKFLVAGQETAAHVSASYQANSAQCYYTAMLFCQERYCKVKMISTA